MSEKNMKEVVLLVDEILNNYEYEATTTTSHCRICHEAEFESSNTLEAPCFCSGTVKFAHRECIQRWCDEKGNTICELCLQNYEPGYTATSKESKQIDTIAISLESTRSQDPASGEEVVVGAVYNGQCRSATDRSGFCLHSFALILTVFLLLRHLFATFTGDDGTEEFPFSPLTIFILRACGIILPMYVMFRAFAAIRKGFRQQYQEYQDLYSYNDEAESNSDGDEGGDEQHLS